MDVNKNDQIQWVEFASSMLFFIDMSKEPKWIKLAFNIIDAENKGYLEREDLYRITDFPIE